MTISLRDVLTWPPGQAPWAKQDEGYAQTVDMPLALLAAEQRTGKTPIILGTAVHQFRKKHIDALLVIAMPSGVPRNWAEEATTRLPPDVRHKTVVWSARKAGQKAFEKELAALLVHDGLAIFAVNGEAVITEACRKYLGRFLKQGARRALVVGDESTLLCKTPGTRRTKVMLAISRTPGAVMRRILDGTVSAEGPLSLYSQFAFLSPSILGHYSFLTFKNRYAKWERVTTYGGQVYPKLIEYQNLEELQHNMAPYTFRVLRKDCYDTPDKIYEKVFFELTTEQRRIYDALRDVFAAEFADGLTITAQHVLTRMLRLQQICSNYHPATKVVRVHAACEGAGCEVCDDLGVIEGTEPLRRIDPKKNPLLDALKDRLTLTSDPVLIGARFRQDIDDIMEMARSIGRKPVRYDGTVSEEEKAIAKNDFQTGNADTCVANQNAAGRGVSFSRAKEIHNYSNSFSLLTRLQFEDRAEIAGKAAGTGIIDYVAEDTVIVDIIEALRGKRSVSDYIMKEKSGSWL